MRTTLPSELPPAYTEFLRTQSSDSDYYFNDRPELPSAGRRWCVYSADHLYERLEIYGAGTAWTWAVLTLLVRLYEEAGGKAVASPEGRLPCTRVASGFAIAEENGDYLYLDPTDSWSVWLYYHDGGDVKRVATSFHDWLNRAQRASAA